MLSNGKVFYKIESDDSFIEAQFLGEKKMLFHVKAEKYPEKLRIMEMLANEEPYMVFDPSTNSIFDKLSE